MMLIDQPITTTDLRKVIEYHLPKPTEETERRLTAFIAVHQNLPAWFVSSLIVTQGKRELRLKLPWPKARHPKSDELEAYFGRGKGSPLQTQKRKEKLYKTLDALYRDMKSIAGMECMVTLYELSHTQELEELHDHLKPLPNTIHFLERPREDDDEPTT